MPNPAIPHDRVHELSEACGDMGEDFQPIASRLIKEQRRLARFINTNFADLSPMAGQVALYMFSVVLRIFDQVGGRMRKVSGRDIDAAVARVQAALPDLRPGEEGFAERAKAVDWRAQPGILDEVLWALYERDEDEKKEGEIDLDPADSALVYTMLWVAVEALDAAWRPPADLAD